MKRHLLLLSINLFVFSTGAMAAQRAVYFSAVGRNTISSGEGLDYSAKATCTLTVTNASNSDQSVTLLNTSSVAISNPPAPPGAATPITPTATAGATSSCTGLTCTLPANTGSATFTWDFGDIAANVGNVVQSVNCSGSFTGADASPTSPGFLVAGGTLISFAESQFKSTYDVTSTSVNRQPIYSQTPISVNSGKPF